jgi:DNA-binding IclR family transcriptional regulator
MPVKGKDYFFINSLAKGLSVIELLVENGDLSATEVAKHLGFNRAGSHRFLLTLQQLGYVEKNADDRYQLTIKVMEMGLRIADQLEIRKLSRPYMEKLSKASNETINLGYFDGADILHIEKIDSKEVLRIDSPLGSRAPAYCTALGKAILASLSEEELEAYLAEVKLTPRGPNTITSKKNLKKELNRIRQQKYAVDDEELFKGLRCVASPIFEYNGRSRYAISISGPTVRHTFDRIDKIHPIIKDVCEEMSRKLGTSVRK